MHQTLRKSPFLKCQLKFSNFLSRDCNSFPFFTIPSLGIKEFKTRVPTQIVSQLKRPESWIERLHALKNNELKFHVHGGDVLPQLTEKVAPFLFMNKLESQLSKLSTGAAAWIYLTLKAAKNSKLSSASESYRLTSSNFIFI